MCQNGPTEDVGGAQEVDEGERGEGAEGVVAAAATEEGGGGGAGAGAGGAAATGKAKSMALDENYGDEGY
jgi:hypothetical protein